MNPVRLGRVAWGGTLARSHLGMHACTRNMDTWYLGARATFCNAAYLTAACVLVERSVQRTRCFGSAARGGRGHDTVTQLRRYKDIQYLLSIQTLQNQSITTIYIFTLELTLKVYI